MSYVSIESIFQLLPIKRENIEKDEVIELAWHAYETLANKGNYERKTCMLQVENYKVKLPIGLWKLEVVAYLPPESFPKINEWLMTTVDINQQEETTTVTYTTSPLTSVSIRGNSPQGINYDRTTSILSQVVTENSAYVIGNPQFQSFFEIMEYTNRPFTTDLHCPYSPNFNCCCGKKYTVSPQNEILTSFESGYIFISYLSHPVDENGSLLIPDDRDFKEAIIAYYMSKYWEYRMNNLEKNTAELYMSYLNKWEKLAMKVRGNMNLQNLNQQAILQHADRYRHIVGSESAWHKKDWYKFTNYKIKF